MWIRALTTAAMASGLRRDALLSLGVQGLAILLTLATGVVVARALGPAEYGAWATSVAALGMFGALAALGLPNLVTRRVSDHQSRHEWQAARTVITRSVSISTVCAVMLALVAAFVVRATEVIPTAARLLFALTMAALPFVTLTNVWAAVLRGLGQGVAAQALSTLLRPLLLLAGVSIAVFALGARAHALLAMLVNLGAAVVTLGAALLLYRRVRPAELASSRASGQVSGQVSGLWQEALPFMVVSLLALVGARIDLFLIAALLDAHAVGLYEVAYRGADLVMLPLTATTAVLAPEYAKRHGLRDQEGLQRLVTQSCRGLLLLSAPLALCLILVPVPIVTFVFGPEYARSADSMALLAAGYLIVLIMGPVHVLAGMVGYSRASAAGALLAALLGTALSLVLIPRYGIQGAALARAIGQTTAAMGLGWLILRRTGIRTTAFARLRPVLSDGAA